MFAKFKKFLLSNFIDDKFKKNPKNYIIQSIFIFICIWLVLFVNKFFKSIIVASLGSSCFILFVSPNSNSSRSRYIIGGYSVGIICGILFNFLYYHVISLNFVGADYILIIICAASAAIATFFMVLTNLEHPPAVAIAVSLTYDPNVFNTALVSLSGAIIMCIIRYLLRKYLKNLI